MKYLRSTAFGSKDLVIRKSEFVTKTQFLNLESLVVNLWTGQQDLIFLNLEIEFIELVEFFNFKQNLSQTSEQVLNYD